MDQLFTPAKLGTCELKNRIVRSATNEHLSDAKGQVTPLWADTLIELAKNEVGLVITGHFCVDKMQRADAGSPCWTRRRTGPFSAAPATACTGTAVNFSSSSATAASRASGA